MFFVCLYFIVAVISAFVQPNISVNPKQTPSENGALCGLTKVELVSDEVIFRTALHEKVSDGYEALPGQYPSFVAIKSLMLDNKDTHCSGVLISDRLVLTAAHCLHKVPFPSRTNVAATIHAYHDWFIKNVTQIKAEKFCLSKKFTRNSKEGTIFDYGIIRLSKAVELSKDVQTACFPSEPVEMEQIGYAVGMGVTDIKVVPGKGKISTEAHGLRVLPVERVKCPKEHESVICFRAHRLMTYRGDTCRGDSGGPVLIKTKQRIQVAGVLSYGEGVCKAGQIGTSRNADVFNQLNHITELIDECNQ